MHTSSPFYNEWGGICKKFDVHRYCELPQVNGPVMEVTAKSYRQARRTFFSLSRQHAHPCFPGHLLGHQLMVFVWQRRETKPCVEPSYRFSRAYLTAIIHYYDMPVWLNLVPTSHISSAPRPRRTRSDFQPDVEPLPTRVKKLRSLLLEQLNGAATSKMWFNNRQVSRLCFAPFRRENIAKIMPSYTKRRRAYLTRGHLARVGFRQRVDGPRDVSYWAKVRLSRCCLGESDTSPRPVLDSRRIFTFRA